jgi:signal peptidase
MLLFVAAGAMGDRRQTSRSRDRENVIAVWAVVLFAAAVVTMAATAAMVVPASTYEIELVATDEPSDDPQVVEPGATAEVRYEVHNGGVIPALVVTDPVDEGVTVEPGRSILGFDERERVTISRTVRESRYLMILPRQVLLGLHSVHPWLALLAVDVVVALFVITVSVAVFGAGYLRMRPGPDVPLRVRVERRLRGLL